MVLCFDFQIETKLIMFMTGRYNNFLKELKKNNFSSSLTNCSVSTVELLLLLVQFY
jgi:uncharacterized membrane protein YqhA